MRIFCKSILFLSICFLFSAPPNFSQEVLCGGYIGIECGQSYNKRGTSSINHRDNYICEGDIFLEHPQKDDGYFINTSNLSRIEISISNISNICDVYVITNNCDNTPYGCYSAQPQIDVDEINIDMDVTNISGVYIIVEPPVIFGELGCGTCPLDYDLKVNCTSSDPTENCNDRSPYCHQAYDIYPNLSNRDEYRIEYNGLLRDNEKPYDWLINGESYENSSDINPSITGIFRPERNNHEVCFRYISEGDGNNYHNNQYETCTKCCFEFCPPVDLFDCNIIEVGEQLGGGPTISVPEKKFNQDIIIINWYAHYPNGNVIYRFEDNERNSFTSAFNNEILSPGNGKIYFTLVYKLGQNGCIQVCCICYDTDRQYEGNIVPIPIDDSSNWLRFQSIDPDIELLDVKITANIETDEDAFLFTPGNTYQVCCLIKDGDCYSWMCFNYCHTYFRQCTDISLTSTSSTNLTYGFNGSGNLLNWYTSDGTKRSTFDKQSGIVPDSYTETDNKIYCVKRTTTGGEISCIELCCYEDRCVDYIPPVFEDFYASNGSINEVNRIIGRRGNGSKNQGASDVCITDTIIVLKNTSDGTTQPYTGQDISSFPHPENWDVCHQVISTDCNEIYEEWCINGSSVGEGECESFPMALPFSVSNGECNDGKCSLILDGSSSMGENLNYVWTVFYNLPTIGIAPIQLDSSDPVIVVDDTDYITGIRLRVINGCGSASVYLSCSDFINQCHRFDDIGSSVFEIYETSPQEVVISSDFDFGDGAQYEIDFGDGSSLHSGSGSTISSPNHSYPRPGTYYICVRVRYYCEIDHGPFADATTTKNCCELIFCKFIKVGCTKTIDRCDLIGYENFSMDDNYVTLDLTAQGNEFSDSPSEWLINGNLVNSQNVRLEYGRDYHCCYVYYNSEGCLVRCCRKFRFEPQNHCGLIRSRFVKVENDGRYTMEFDMTGSDNTPISWSVKGLDNPNLTKPGDRVEYTLPANGISYEICVLYYDREGCLRVCCFCITIPREGCDTGPYAYSSDSVEPLITFIHLPDESENAITFQFSLNEEGAEAESWNLTSEDGQLIQSFDSPDIICPPGWTGKPVKVCVLYRLGNCYYYRCFPVIFENPLLCKVLKINEISGSPDEDIQVEYTGTDDVLDYYWTLNGVPVQENTSARSISLCCLDPNESNILCYYYKVSYGEYCVWRVCCIELEGEGCDLITAPLIEDLYFVDNTDFIIGRRANGSKNSGYRWELECEKTDTVYHLKNLKTGQVTTYTHLRSIDIPEGGKYELCNEIRCQDAGLENYSLEKSCITIQGGRPGDCKVKPMALPFTWKQVGDNCLQVFPVKCFYRFDASHSMGDNLTYSWSVYYADTSNYIDNSVHFSSDSPVFDTSLIAGFTAIKLTISNNCGSSTFYMACTDWTISCLDFSDVNEDFFRVDASLDHKTVQVQSSFSFPVAANITVNYGDNSIENLENTRQIGNLSHEYEKPGVYYVCVRVLLTCDNDEDHDTKKCCEIIFCKYVEVGCVQYTSRCDWLSYEIIEVKEDHLYMGLFVKENFPWEIDTWTVNGEIIDPDSVLIEYGKTYYYCITYLDEEGCLVECCRKIKFNPPYNCNVIRPIFKGIGAENKHRFDFSLNTDFEEIIFWSVKSSSGSYLSTENISTFDFIPGQEYTICVLYYDREGCLRFCCYCLKVDPVHCSSTGSPYEYVSTGEDGISYQLDVDLEGASDVTWTLSDQEGNQLDESSDNILTCPPGRRGDPLVACIQYRIGDCHYIRCIPIICIDPRNCSSLEIEYSEADEGVYDISFTEDVDFEQSYWTLNGDRLSQSENQRTLNICCLDPGSYEVCFYYLVRINGYCYWKVCCYPIPSPCNPDEFKCDRWFRPIPTSDDGMISYTYDNDFVEVSRIEVNGTVVSENKRDIHLNPDEYEGPITICYWIIGPDGCSYICCKTLDPHCDCPPEVDPLYCEKFTGKTGKSIGAEVPEWWTPTSVAGVESSLGETYLDAGNGEAILDLRNKTYNYLSIEMEIGNCYNSIGFDISVNSIDDEGSIVFPGNTMTGCFYQNSFGGICNPLFFDRNQRILLELTGDQLKTVSIDGIKVGEIYAPELIKLNGDPNQSDCMKIYAICIGNKKNRIPEYCSNQITQSLYLNDFETFKDGDFISIVDPNNWIVIGGLDARIVKDYIAPGKQLHFSNGGGYDSDAILKLESQDKGKYQIRWDMGFYDPDAGEARTGEYYILQSQDTNSIDRRVIRVKFLGDPDDNHTGHGVVEDMINNQSYNFSYPVNDFIAYYDRTFTNLLDFDLDKGELSMEIAGHPIKVSYTSPFAGIEYLAISQDPVSDYIVDNICYGRKSSGGGNPGNDPCLNATPLTCGTTVSGTTSREQNEFSLYPCATTSMNGPDKIYSFEVKVGDPPMRLNLFDLSDPELQIIVTDDCDMSKSRYCKGTNSRSQYRTVDLGSLPPGTYYTFIDGVTKYTMGSYKIQLSCESLDCSDAIPIDCNQSTTGDNYNGRSNVSYYPACPIRSAICMTAPEKVYSFTPDSTGTYTVRLNIHGSADLDVFVLDGCSPHSCVHSGIKPPGNNESFQVRLVKGTTYYLIVDGQFDQRGSFDLLIECPRKADCHLPDFDFVARITDSIVDVQPTVLSGVESISWDFGDGSTSTITDPDEHTYTSNGRYTICGTAGNACGKYKICREVNINVNTKPGTDEELSFDTPLNGCLEEESEVRIPVFLRGATSISNLGIQMQSSNPGKINIIGFASQYPLDYNILDNGSRISILNESKVEDYDTESPLFELIINIGDYTGQIYQIKYLEITSLDGIILSRPIDLCLKKKTSVLHVSGKVYDYQKGIGLEEVSVWLDDEQELTDYLGHFKFAPSASKSAFLISKYIQGHPRDRINVLDIKAIKRHWLEYNTLDPFRKVAADVNNDKEINAQDWGFLTQLVAHQLDSLPDTPIWRVYSEEQESLVSKEHNDIGQLPDKVLLNPDSKDPIKLFAIKTGDVSDKTVRSRSGSTLDLQAIIERKLDHTFIRIKPTHDARISAAQFCIQLPERYVNIELTKTSKSFEEAAVHIADGKIYVVFAPMAEEGVLLHEDESILSIQVYESEGESVLTVDDMSMDYAALPSIAATIYGKLGHVALSAKEYHQDDQVTIHPNPFSDYVWLHVQNHQGSPEGRFDLYNLMGQRIVHRTLQLDAGLTRHFVRLDQHLPPGLYIARWITDRSSQEFKLIKK